LCQYIHSSYNGPVLLSQKIASFILIGSAVAITNILTLPTTVAYEQPSLTEVTDYASPAHTPLLATNNLTTLTEPELVAVSSAVPEPNTGETLISETTSATVVPESSTGHVPFYSQFKDITDPTWQKVGCGIASLAMLIDYYKPAVSVDSLLTEGITTGAYITSAGWSHADSSH